MLNFLHTFTPSPILISFGPVNVYWYGICIVSGLLAAILVAFRVAEKYKLSKDLVIDLAFWLMFGGIIGARLFHVVLEFSYYRANPIEILKPWHGGLAIHGGIIAGLIILYFFARRRQLNFWLLASAIAPGLALGQAIGRFGNYFNQELFGRQTDLPWGIPIDFARRPSDYQIFTHFHPVFLYENLGNLAIFGLLVLMHRRALKNNGKPIRIVLTYLIAYSVLRFCLEFIRIDPTSSILGMRFPQIVSLIVVCAAIILMAWDKYGSKKLTLAKFL